MSISGCASSHAISEEKLKIARRTGEIIVDLVRKNSCEDIVTLIVLRTLSEWTRDRGIHQHLSASYRHRLMEFGIDLEAGLFDKISRETKHIVALNQAGSTS